jgi:hypothetical protein
MYIHILRINLAYTVQKSKGATFSNLSAMTTVLTTEVNCKNLKICI